jgi:hypothetical protein
MAADTAPPCVPFQAARTRPIDPLHKARSTKARWLLPEVSAMATQKGHA